MRRNEPSGIAIHHRWLTFAVDDAVNERQGALIITNVLVMRMRRAESGQNKTLSTVWKDKEGGRKLLYRKLLLRMPNCSLSANICSL
jgi:hypothetical protein